MQFTGTVSSRLTMVPGRNIVIAALFIILVGNGACKKNDLKEVEDLTSKSVPAEYSTGVEVIYSDSAKVKARLTAPNMVRYLTKDPSIEMPKGLYVQFFDDFLNVKSWMRADYGIRYLNTGITKVTGNVQVRNVKGDSLNTEEMFWDEKKEKVYGTKQVTVRTKTQVIIADGFESNIGFTNYSFHNIKGIINLPGPK
jgi:LPS export ABC transporter protein LptC